jgi:hypothetical protein
MNLYHQGVEAHVMFCAISTGQPNSEKILTGGQVGPQTNTHSRFSTGAHWGDQWNAGHHHVAAKNVLPTVVTHQNAYTQLLGLARGTDDNLRGIMIAAL